MGQQFKNVLKYFLPVLFVTYLASTTFFNHVHMIDGVTVVHSHPFNKHLKHTHSKVEFLSIYLLSHLITEGDAVTLWTLFVPLLLAVLLLGLPVSKQADSCYAVVSLRAPPAC
ncbi:MAG: hypothetical protein EOM31_06695 [Bacteroidia bacterium]|nr:hypothetical protein [Bacteroidia bacterium]